MTCPLCGNKPGNCDCTQEAYELNNLRNELAEQRNSQSDRELFELYSRIVQSYILANKGAEADQVEIIAKGALLIAIAAKKVFDERRKNGLDFRS